MMPPTLTFMTMLFGWYGAPSLDEILRVGQAPPVARRVQVDCHPFLMESGGNLGAAIRLHVSIEGATKGHEYELRYQIRVHTGAGKTGPLLGTKDDPSAAFPLLRAKADVERFFLSEEIDLTRKEVGQLTGLPLPPANKFEHEVFLRVEGHLFDVTAKQYLTATKAPAVILVATVAEGGKVYSLQSLAHWVANRASAIYDTKKELERLDDLDEYPTHSNRIEGAIERVLGESGVPSNVKVLYIERVNLGVLLGQEGAQLRKQLEALAVGSDPVLKKAALKPLKKLKELSEPK